MARKLLSTKGNQEKGVRMHILAIDDDPEFLTFLEVSLKDDFIVRTANDFVSGAESLRKNPIDLVLLDISLGNENGLKLIRKAKEIRPSADIVIVTGHKDPTLLVEAIRLGASDYLVKPFAVEEVIAIIEKLSPYRDIREKHAALLEDLNESSAESLILGRSEFLLNQLKNARKLKGQGAHVLIEGESGTGKELFARYIHRLDERKERPFIAINCAAIPDTLLESELFGHEKGAFTGATERKVGKFELANGGDLFLDEVSSLKKDLQAKILRAIQEQEVIRIGGTKPVQVRFRVIAATNEPLEGLVERGLFRRDLFHRLRVITLTIPPLRERTEDIPILVDAFLKKHATTPGWALNKAALMALGQYSWPGNVRELENLIQSLVILVAGPTITVSDLPGWIFSKPKGNGTATMAFGEFALPNTPAAFLALKEFVNKTERAYISRALQLMKGDKSKTAAILQMSRTRLYERLKMWGDEN